MFKWFTERAHRVIVLAVEEAKRLNHNVVGAEHILLGIIREGEGAAINVLESLNISPGRVRRDIEIAIDWGERTPQEGVAFTPQAKKVLELALDEARRLGHGFIGAEHLLLGLIREGEGVAARVLKTMGAGLEQLERVRSQVVLLRERERTPCAKTAEDLDKLLLDLALLEVRTCLIQTLLELARTRGEVGSEGVFIASRLTQSDLANMVGATTESIDKWLQHYIKEGLLRYHRGRLTLLDLKRLREDLYDADLRAVRALRGTGPESGEDLGN